MRKCASCGVFVDSGDVCPLCGEPLPELSAKLRSERPTDERAAPLEGGGRSETEGPPRSEVPAPTPGAGDAPGDAQAVPSAATMRRARLWLAQVATLVAGTAALVTFAADFGYGFDLSWSLLPLAGIGFVWLLAVTAILLTGRAGVLLAAETAVVAPFLLVLSRIAGAGDWYLPLALPVVLMLAVLTAFVAGLATRLRLAALQVVAVVVLACGLFLAGIERLVNRYTGSEVILSWSIVAFACSLSLFFLILFINRRLRERHAEYRRIFHI